MLNSKEIGLLIQRISIGFLMLLHGIAKLNGIGGIKQMLANFGVPTFLGYGVYITEIIAPVLIIAGYRTKFASIVFAFGALAALVLGHGPNYFGLGKHGGWSAELIGLYLLGSIVLIFTGGGKLSISSKNKWD